MAMQRKLWSLNALSSELNLDRRTLAKRLQSLPAAETKDYNNRTEKLWHMADVVAHLQKLETDKASDGKAPAINGFRMIHEESIKHFIWWLTDEIAQAWTGMLKVDGGLEPNTIKQLYGTNYYLLVHFMEKYLCDDIFNQILADSSKHDFDQLHYKAHGEIITSHPPKKDELEFQLPAAIQYLIDNDSTNTQGSLI